MRRGRSILLPRYSEREGWKGGEKNRLYAFKDKRTGKEFVRPVHMTSEFGPAMSVRPATRAEAEALYQSPLHSGWKVND